MVPALVCHPLSKVGMLNYVSFTHYAFYSIFFRWGTDFRILEVDNFQRGEKEGTKKQGKTKKEETRKL